MPPTDRAGGAELELFFDLSIDLLCIAGADGYFKRLNPAFFRVLGWSEEELLGRPFLEFVHPDDREATLSQVQSMGEGARVIDFENQYRCRDGSYRHLSWRAAPSSDGRLLVAAARDMTEIRRAERERLEALQRSEAILENVVEGVITIDYRGKVEFFSPSAERIFGYAAEQVVGRNVRLLMPEPYRSEHDAYLNRYFRGGEPHVIGIGREVVGLRRDGSTFPAELSVSEIRIGDRPVFTGLVRDISDRKAVESAKSEFVSVVSHELRTPLTSIRASLGLIEGGVLGALPPKMERMISIALSNTERLVRLVNDILDLERIESGRIQLHLEEVDPFRFVRLAIEGLRDLAAESQVELEVEAGFSWEGRGLELLADCDRLEQVMTNLLSNAIKYSKAGGRVTTGLELTSRPALRVHVSDRGPGIPAEHLESIFERFRQVDSSDARAKGGTGLGLAICRAIVEEHGGRIGVDSRVGEGSTFWFELPVRAAATLDSLQPRGPRVLVVEDDEELAEVLASTLGADGYEVRSLHSLRDARAAIREDRLPDALVLDLTLPDGSGLDLLTELRLEERTSRMPVVVMTGSAAIPDPGRSAEAVVDWILKPFDRARLSIALRRAVDLNRPTAVLVVEDDPDTRELIATMLRAEGVRTLEAADGQSALELVSKSLPDLIILDLDLPDIDGFRVVDRLRWTDARSTPLIVYSGQDTSPAERTRLTLGQTRHLTKSVDTEDSLLEAVGDLLQGLLPEEPEADPG